MTPSKIVQVQRSISASRLNRETGAWVPPFVSGKVRAGGSVGLFTEFSGKVRAGDSVGLFTEFVGTIKHGNTHEIVLAGPFETMDKAMLRFDQRVWDLRHPYMLRALGQFQPYAKGYRVKAQEMVDKPHLAPDLMEYYGWLKARYCAKSRGCKARPPKLQEIHRTACIETSRSAGYILACFNALTQGLRIEPLNEGSLTERRG